MGVLTIRAHKRFALRLPVKLDRLADEMARGLMIEISQRSARISNLGCNTYKEGEALTVIAPIGTGAACIKLEGAIRWSHDGLAGIRLARSLHVSELNALLEANRRQEDGEALHYGT